MAGNSGRLSGRVRWAAAVAVLLTLTGCGEKAGPPVSDAMKHTVRSLVALDVEAEAAVNAKLRDCARKVGWTREIGASLPAGPTQLHGFTSVFKSAKEAEDIGYRVLIREPRSSPELPEDMNLKIYGADREAAAGDGTLQVRVELEPGGTVVSEPATGCLAEARTAVYGSVEDHIRLSNVINRVLNSGSNRAQSRFLGVLGDVRNEFSACMKGHGYDIGVMQVERWVSQNMKPYQDAGEKPSGEELRLASADGACQEQVRLAQKLDDAYFEVAGDWVKKHESDLLALAEKKKQAHERALAVLNSTEGKQP